MHKATQEKGLSQPGGWRPRDENAAKISANGTTVCSWQRLPCKHTAPDSPIAGEPQKVARGGVHATSGARINIAMRMRFATKTQSLFSAYN